MEEWRAHSGIGQVLQIEDRIDAPREDWEPVTQRQDALPATAVTQTTYDSARTGSAVDVRDAVGTLLVRGEQGL